jgi:hypothetical protein
MSAPEPWSSGLEKLYNKPLTEERVAEMRHNLVGYIEVLIQMDCQYQEYLKVKGLQANDNK